MSFMGGLGERIRLDDIRRLTGARQTSVADDVTILQPSRQTTPRHGDTNEPANCWHLVRILAEPAPAGRFMFKLILIRGRSWRIEQISGLGFKKRSAQQEWEIKRDDPSKILMHRGPVRSCFGRLWSRHGGLAEFALAGLALPSTRTFWRKSWENPSGFGCGKTCLKFR